MACATMCSQLDLEGVAGCVSANVESQFSSGGGLEPGFFEFGWYCMIDVRVVRYCM